LKQPAIIILILFWLGWHLAAPIDLVRSDLGRHIKNGELILHGDWNVLYKNYYSYTYPEYPFFNYHWLFGVFCYAVWHYFGFTGLSLIYLLLELLAFYAFFCCCRRYTSFVSSCAFGLLSFPLIAFRNEIRPEGISYLFCGLYWWMLDAYQQKRIKLHHLTIGLSVLQIIWVNTHIFFMLGPILTAIFWWQAQIKKEKQQANVLQKLFFLLTGMCLINPFGINVFWLPFDAWGKASAFPIIESLSVWCVLNEKILAFTPVLLYFLAASVMLNAALFFLIKREGFKKFIFIGAMTLILSFAAIKVMRMIGLFGYFWMFLSTYFYSMLVQAETAKFKKNIETVLLVIGIIVSASGNLYLNQKHALGIIPGSNVAGEFFKREKISGAIFNNYGIGGYLIFHLSPQHQLFIDNRGEAAFPEDFINKTYVQMQWNDAFWHQLDQKYHFNAIFCSPEHSSWAAKFIANRLADHDWALVFQSEEVRIFLKRNAQNAPIISRNEIHLSVSDAETYYNSGTMNAKQGNFTQALSDYNKAIGIDPHYANAYNNRGFIYGIQGDLTHALFDFNKAIEINPGFVDAYNNRALSYYQLKEYDKAWADVHKVEELGAAVNPDLLENLKKISGQETL